MSSSPASNPKSPDVSEKNKKYDRQLRLWGDHGQAALETASVCLVNATATGTETLKSLVLAGLGSFTIVDEKTVADEDVGVNFFLTADCVGENRGQATCRLLRELNSDVSGDYITSGLDRLLDSEPEKLTKFSVVVVTDVNDTSLCRLADLLWTRDIPLLVCRCYGLLASIRLQLQEHAVVESHPDSVVADLRLLEPFPELRALLEAEATALPSMERRAHSHTPYTVVVYAALQRWRQEHDGKTPANYRERQQFKQVIEQMRYRDEETGAPLEEENFSEAERAVNTVLTPAAIPSNLQEILDSPQCDGLTDKSADFWVLARAVKEFVAHEGAGRLPVRGDLPDMTADSDRYIHMQNVYRDEARRGVEAVWRRVQALLESLGRPAHLISEEQVRTFCRNTHALRVQQGTSIQREMSSLTLPANEAASLLQSPDSELAVYALIRATERFRVEFGSYPGAEDDQVETDVVKLKGCLTKLLSEWGLQNTVKDDYVQEMCRYGGLELHSVAAFVGGCAAHEVVKLATGQYAPIDNTFVYNGITSSSQVFKL